MLFGMCHMLCPPYGWVSALRAIVCVCRCKRLNEISSSFRLDFSFSERWLCASVCVCVSDSLADWLIARASRLAAEKKNHSHCVSVLSIGVLCKPIFIPFSCSLSSSRRHFWKVVAAAAAAVATSTNSQPASKRKILNIRKENSLNWILRSKACVHRVVSRLTRTIKKSNFVRSNRKSDRTDEAIEFLRIF